MTAAPLRGVRVIDAGRLMPSSVATAELAALGAEVIKIELPPHGDYLRINPPLIAGRGDMHLHINRGKKSLGIDLHQPEGREILDRLVETSDVLVELSRPGAGASLGMDPERLRQLNPRLVHCSITGFGHTGPYSPLGAHGLSADASAGLLGLERDGDRWLLPEPYVSVGPRASGLYAAIDILGALFEARRTGVGTFLDVSQWDAALSWNYRDLVLAANEGTRSPAYRDLGPKYDVYETADGGWVLLCVPEPKLWRSFCAATDRPDLLGDDSDAVIEYLDDHGLRRRLQVLFSERHRDDWVQLGIDTGIPIAPVVPVEELADNPHTIARNMIREEDHPLGGTVRLPGRAVKHEGLDDNLWPAPELGQHTEEILEALGYDRGAFDSLSARGVIVTDNK